MFYAGSTAPTGYTGFSNVEQNGKGKGAVAMTVSNAAKNYLVILKKQMVILKCPLVAL
jgi:hypothetical protein